MATERIHDRLPWYVNGTLGTEEAMEFQRHLGVCGACKEELRVLETLKEEIERHGEDFLPPHPPPEELAAVVVPDDTPLPEPEASAVRRHLAICATCGEESRWLRGEVVGGVIGPDTSIAAGKVRQMRPFLAGTAVAAVAMAGLILVLRTLTEPAWVLVVKPPPQFIDATQRAGVERTTIHTQPGETVVRVYLEVDFEERAFPLTLEIRGADGNTVLRQSGIAASDLARGRFLFLDLPRSRFPDGDYVARLSIAASFSAPPEEFPMRLTSVPQR